MKTQRNSIAFVLIALGALALLSRLGGDTGWLWVGLVSAAFLFFYNRDKRYSSLVVGSILAGVALGILVEGAWGFEGAFLISLGIGFGAIDRVAPRSNRWPFFVGILLIGLGLISGLVESGILGSFWFALVLIGGGAYLLSRSRDRSRGWVTAKPRPKPAEAPAAEATPATPAQPEVAEAAPEAAPAADPELETRRLALEAWRTAQAEEEGRAAYLILTNETIAQLAADRPTTLEEVRRIKGIGPVKLDRYGASILEVLESV